MKEKNEIEKTATIESPKIQVDANGPIVFFPSLPYSTSLQRILRSPRSSVNIVHSIRSSLFQIRGRVARPTAFEECNGPHPRRTARSKKRTDEKKAG